MFYVALHLDFLDIAFFSGEREKKKKFSLDLYRIQSVAHRISLFIRDNVRMWWKNTDPEVSEPRFVC